MQSLHERHDLYFRIRVVEALWDHVTEDPEELSFEAGERLVVVDATDADWWYATYLDQVRESPSRDYARSFSKARRES